jgi:hypothetical protein
MSHRRWWVSPLVAVVLAAPLFAACAEGVPIEDLFPVDAGSKPSSGSAGTISAGSIDTNGSGDTSTSGAGGSVDNGTAGSIANGGAGGNGNGTAGSSSAGAGGGSGGASGSGGGGSTNHAGSAGSGGSSAGCTAPAWDSMTVYCGQGMVGTEVSLNGKKYTCHYWTQAQNPEDHNSADNSEPWSTPTSCP